MLSALSRAPCAPVLMGERSKQKEQNTHKIRVTKCFTSYIGNQRLINEKEEHSLLRGKTSQEVTLQLELERQRASQARRWVYGGVESKQVAGSRQDRI